MEVYPYKLSVFRMSVLSPSNPTDPAPVITISKTATIQELLEKVIELSNLDRNDLRFWLVPYTYVDNEPIEGSFYPSQRIKQDEAHPFPGQHSPSERLDVAYVDAGDAIVYEYKSQGVWTVDLGSLNITQKSGVRTQEESKSPVFGSDWAAKYNTSTNNAIKPTATAAAAAAAPTVTPVTSPRTTNYSAGISSTSVTSYQYSSSTALTTNGRASATSTKAPGTVGLNNLLVSFLLQCF